jgi:ParB family chromosome partitioning protein
MLEALQVTIQHIGIRDDYPRVANDAVIDRMANSLSMAGQLQPIGVRRAGEGWVLIFGYVRLLAAKRLGWTTIWAVVLPEFKKQEHVDLALWAIENLHHEPPELDELALVVKRMVDAGMSDSVIALALGKNVDWVTGMIDICRNPMARRLIATGRLSELEAWFAFMRLTPSEKKYLLDSTEPITVRNCKWISEGIMRKIPVAKQKSSNVLQQEDNCKIRDLWSDLPETGDAKQPGMLARGKKNECQKTVR